MAVTTKAIRCLVLLNPRQSLRMAIRYQLSTINYQLFKIFVQIRRSRDFRRRGWWSRVARFGR